MHDGCSGISRWVFLLMHFLVVTLTWRTWLFHIFSCRALHVVYLLLAHIALYAYIVTVESMGVGHELCCLMTVACHEMAAAVHLVCAHVVSNTRVLICVC